MTGPPRLLYVFHSLGPGGAQTRFVRIANRFGPNVQHLVVALNGDYSILNQIQPVVHVEVVCPLLKSSFLDRVEQYKALVKQISPACLITHNWGTIEWALGQKRVQRHIHIEDGFGTDELNGQKLRRVLFRRIALRSSEVVVPSRTLVRIAQNSWKISKDRLHFIPNGISLADFSNYPMRASRPKWGSKVIGTVAALRPEKNIARLLRAFAKLRSELNCELRIIGDGPERNRLELLAEDLGVSSSVVFCGYLADPRTQFAEFDIFALSSDTEQMPYTVLEAMASGLPIVATDVGDVKTMVSDENSGLICSKDPDALAAGIVKVLENPQLAYLLSRSNRMKVQQEYDIESMHQAFAKLYGVSLPPEAA